MLVENAADSWVIFSLQVFGRDGGAVVGVCPSPYILAINAGLEVKSGVDMSNLSFEITSAFDEISAAWQAIVPNITPVITSANERLHSFRSLHYENLAIDLRANNLTDAQANAIVANLSAALGSGFDIIYENYGTSNDHIHFEYDPD